MTDRINNEDASNHIKIPSQEFNSEETFTNVNGDSMIIRDDIKGEIDEEDIFDQL